MLNNDLKMGIAKPRKSVKGYFIKMPNATGIIRTKGSGILKTFVGNLEFGYGDYLIIPRGTIYQIEFKDEDNILFL